MQLSWASEFCRGILVQVRRERFVVLATKDFTGDTVTLTNVGEPVVVEVRF